MKIKLWDHQVKAIEEAKKQNNYALFMEPGTGKTLTTIEILKNVYSGNIRKTVILAPLIVLENWQREFLKYSDIPGNKILILSGPVAKRIVKFKTQILKDPNFIVVTNYEGIVGKSGMLEELIKWKPQVLVCDESQKVKAHDTIRSKNVFKLALGVDNCYILSGSPILNSPMDIFQQYKILDKGETFGRNFTNFKITYFYDANAGMPSHVHFPDWKIQNNKIQEMTDKIYTKALFVRKSDCLDLPPMVRKTIYVEMSPEQAKLYKEMKNHFITFINEQAVTATIALTKALRMLQITSGFVKTETGEEISLDDNTKKNALREVLEEITPIHKVLVWCVFKKDYEHIIEVCKKIGVKYAHATGEDSVKEKQLQVDYFNNDTSCRVFFGHPQALGIGINLVAASYSVYYSRNFSLENDIQSEARNYRGGSEIHESITRIDLVMKDTIDEIILEALANKEDVADKILTSLKEIT